MSDFGTALIEAADAIEATIQHRRIYVYTDRQGGKVIEYAEDRSGEWRSYSRRPVQIEEIQSEIQHWVEAQTVLCHDDIVAGECSCTPWELMRDDAVDDERTERWNDPQRPPKGPGSGVYNKPEPKVIVVKNEENA